MANDIAAVYAKPLFACATSMDYPGFPASRSACGAICLFAKQTKPNQSEAMRLNA